MPVTTILGERLGPTLLLMGLSLVVAYLIGIPLGILSGRKNGTWLDSSITAVSFLGISIPSFFFGLAMVYIFGVRLGILPTGGMYPLGTTPYFWSHHATFSHAGYCLAAAYLANMTRYMRATTIDVYEQTIFVQPLLKG